MNLQGRINGNLNLSRALGDFMFKNNPNLSMSNQMVIADPEVMSIEREQVQFIMLGCDGIWEKKDAEKMVKWIYSKRKSPNNTHLCKVL